MVLPFLVPAYPRCPGKKAIITAVVVVVSKVFSDTLLLINKQCNDCCLQCFDAVVWAAGRASGL